MHYVITRRVIGLAAGALLLITAACGDTASPTATPISPPTATRTAAPIAPAAVSTSGAGAIAPAVPTGGTAPAVATDVPGLTPAP